MYEEQRSNTSCSPPNVARGWERTVHGIGKPNKDNVIACATDYIQCNRKGRDMLRLNIGGYSLHYTPLHIHKMTRVCVDILRWNAFRLCDASLLVWVSEEMLTRFSSRWPRPFYCWNPLEEDRMRG